MDNRVCLPISIMLMMVVSPVMGYVEYGTGAYSSGVYDYDFGGSTWGNAGGSGNTVYAPDGFSVSTEWEGYNCGNGQDFGIETWQTLSFYKMPSTPDDPYFSDYSMTYGTGNERDTATITTTAGLSFSGNYAGAGISTGIESTGDYVEYGFYSTDYQGWSAEGELMAYSFDNLVLHGGASFDPDTSLYPYAGMTWEIDY